MMDENEWTHAELGPDVWEDEEANLLEPELHLELAEQNRWKAFQE